MLNDNLSVIGRTRKALKVWSRRGAQITAPGEGKDIREGRQRQRVSLQLMQSYIFLPVIIRCPWSIHEIRLIFPFDRKSCNHKKKNQWSDLASKTTSNICILHFRFRRRPLFHLWSQQRRSLHPQPLVLLLSNHLFSAPPFIDNNPLHWAKGLKEEEKEKHIPQQIHRCKNIKIIQWKWIKNQHYMDDT